MPHFNEPESQAGRLCHISALGYVIAERLLIELADRAGPPLNTARERLMKHSAVIFDLFGTLVVTFSSREYHRLLREMAEAVGAPPPEFARLWMATCNERWTGSFGTIGKNIEHICGTLGVAVSPACAAGAARLRVPVVIRSISPRNDAASTLACLKAAGCRLGLISDCSAEVPEYWPHTPFAPLIDVPIFSCSVGVRKPDPRIYRLACDRLGVKPEDCIYVGDGGSHELSGAAQVGMHPVLIRVPEEDLDGHRVDGEEWHGTKITRLSELLEMV